MTPSRDITGLIAIMAALRNKDGGCPWDLEQTFATIAPYTIEEAHEVAEAIAANDMDGLRDELGDLLFQVVYHARLAEEIGAFTFADVVEAITTKMIRRHPHVFGDDAARRAGAAKGFWEKAKAAERRANGTESSGLLDSVSAGRPPYRRAQRLQEKASTVGFDWNDPRGGPGQASRRDRRDRSRTGRWRPGSSGGRGGRPPLRGGQPRPPRAGRSRPGAAARQPEVCPPVCGDRGGSGCRRANAPPNPISRRWKRSGRKRRS